MTKTYTIEESPNYTNINRVTDVSVKKLSEQNQNGTSTTKWKITIPVHTKTQAKSLWAAIKMGWWAYRGTLVTTSNASTEISVSACLPK